MGNLLLEREARDDSSGGDDKSKGSHHDDITIEIVQILPTAIPTAFPTAIPTAAILSAEPSNPLLGAVPSSLNMPFPSWTGEWERPTGMPYLPSTFWTHPSPTTIPTQSSKPTPWSENHSLSGTPTPIYTDLPGPTTTSVNHSGDGSDGFQRQGSNHTRLYAAGGIIPMVIIAILGVALFFYLRKRKQKKQQAALGVGGQEMVKTRSSAYILPVAQQTSPGIPPPPTSQAYYASAALPPSNSSPLQSPRSPQPVILGPIVPSSNGAYYTGIDTSDVVSMTGGPPPPAHHDRTGLGNPFVDGDSIHEEPPPPYRPTSLPPLSRDTSLRAPPSVHSRTNLIVGHDDQPAHSPFADPPDGNEDAVSVLEDDGAQARSGRAADNMSAVSDLSYQADPVVSRPAV